MSGPCSLKALFVEDGPVSNASVEETDMDVVEVVRRVDPHAAAVVDHETEIFGRTWSEGWGEIAS